MSRQQELIDRIGQLSPHKLSVLRAHLDDDKDGGQGDGQVSEPQNGKLMLAAFVTTTTDQTISVDQLRESLLQSLPDYMVPASFILLDRFPLLPNGKVDVSALSVRQTTNTTLGKAQSVDPDTEGKQVEDRSTEDSLIEIWCKVLQADYIDVDDNFFEMGGDSILSIQVVSLAHQSGLALVPNDMFDYPTIAQLAAQLGVRKTNADHLADQMQLPQPDSGQAPLTPIQHWFLNQQMVSPAHWNQNVLLEIDADLSAELLEKSIDALTRHHGALRTSFLHEHDGMYQQVTTQLSPDFNVINLSADEDIDTVITDKAGIIQTQFSLDRAPLISFTQFHCAGESPDRLLICAHHLVIDAISWRILIEDFEQSCRLAIRGEAIELPSRSASYLQWSLSLEKFTNSTDIQSELDYWASLPLSETSTIPRDHDDIDPLEGNADTVTVMLDANDTTALTSSTHAGSVHSAYKTTVIDLLLTALARVLSRWTKRGQNSIGLEGHGREPLDGNIDTARTIGWFTSFYPVCLDIDIQNDMASDIKRIKEIIHRIPNRGIGYGLLRYISNNKNIQDKLNVEKDIQVLFNYLGNTDQINASALFRKLPVDCEPQRDTENSRAHLLDINCHLSAGRLMMNWTYDRNIHHRETIETLADGYADTLQQLIHHCLDPDSGGYTPSDFPDAGLDQEALDDFINKLT
jgi:non-ribosomal peptide synthase protein (TIGR01720 family)